MGTYGEPVFMRPRARAARFRAHGAREMLSPLPRDPPRPPLALYPPRPRLALGDARCCPHHSPSRALARRVAPPQVGKYTHVAARLAERGHPDVVCLQEAKELSSYAAARAAAAAASAAARAGHADGDGGGGDVGIHGGLDDDADACAPELIESCFSQLAEVGRVLFSRARPGGDIVITVGSRYKMCNFCSATSSSARTRPC